jgi:hypothetical protein
MEYIKLIIKFDLSKEIDINTWNFIKKNNLQDKMDKLKEITEMINSLINFLK